MTLAPLIHRARALGLRVRANQYLNRHIAMRAERELERAWALRGLMRFNLSDCRESAATVRWSYRRVAIRLVPR